MSNKVHLKYQGKGKIPTVLWLFLLTSLNKTCRAKEVPPLPEHLLLPFAPSHTWEEGVKAYTTSTIPMSLQYHRLQTLHGVEISTTETPWQYMTIYNVTHLATELLYYLQQILKITSLLGGFPCENPFH